MNCIERKVISFLDKQEWKSVIKSYKKEELNSFSKKLPFEYAITKVNYVDVHT